MLRREILQRDNPPRTETWEVLIHQVAVAGRVLHAETNRPIADAEVTIKNIENDLRLVKRSASDGHYHYLDLPNGNYSVSAKLPGVGTRYSTAKQSVAVARNAVGDLVMGIADLVLRPTLIYGRVVNGGDEPVLLADVRMKGNGERTFSDAEGRYKLMEIETSPEPRKVVFSARGYRTRMLRVELKEAGLAVELNCTLERAKS